MRQKNSTTCIKGKKKKKEENHLYQTHDLKNLSSKPNQVKVGAKKFPLYWLKKQLLFIKLVRLFQGYKNHIASMHFALDSRIHCRSQSSKRKIPTSKVDRHGRCMNL
ncbi:hypothetical protein L6164_000444 [Bauhinia variegata]|uniref:Uncharacterized protein n=1 Tax=Bauhinia variegata TaxID=167791 RepID=A0ACB9QC88_BAUVA|nr:hypothetical protein L6164_000444 [Bauhinia variegata]